MYFRKSRRLVWFTLFHPDINVTETVSGIYSQFTVLFSYIRYCSISILFIIFFLSTHLFQICTFPMIHKLIILFAYYKWIHKKDTWVMCYFMIFFLSFCISYLDFHGLYFILFFLCFTLRLTYNIVYFLMLCVFIYYLDHIMFLVISSVYRFSLLFYLMISLII